MRAAVVGCLLLVAGCATSSGGFGHSEVYPVDQKDAPTFALAITDFVAMRESPGDGPIFVQPAGGDDPVAPLLKHDLAGRGYRVTIGGSPVNRVLKYEIGPFAHSTLLRVSLNGGDAAKLYTRSGDGVLVAVSPFAARGPGEAS